jgi:hypothetical protein
VSWWRAAAFFAALLASGPSAAHTRSQSYSAWTVDGATLTGIFQVDARRVTQLSEQADAGNLGDLLAGHLSNTVRVTQQGARCDVRPPRVLAAARGDVRVELSFTCPKSIVTVPVDVVIGAFFEVSPSHVHYARVARPGGQAQEVLATVRSHAFEVGANAQAPPTDLGAFFRLGLEHVLSGVDHLAFLLALALLAGSFGRAFWAATGFTLGHSLTLGLVALGWLSPNVPAVEALIGFTVAFAAGEAYASRPGRTPHAGWITLGLVAAVPLAAKLVGASLLPWAVVAGTAVFAACAGGLGGGSARRLAPVLAAAFGLAHGAGFAGALLELDIPRERLLTALLGFNLGVEAAQLLALVVVAAIALAAARIPPHARSRALDYVTATLFAVGTYWFVERALVLG